jgi:hypothetical protein
MIYRFLAIQQHHDLGCTITIYGDVNEKFTQLHRVNIDLSEMWDEDINHICENYIGGEINEMLAKYGDAYDINKINTQIL